MKNLIILFLVIFSLLFCSNGFTQENTNKEVWIQNPNASKLFFAPTAFGLQQGKGYFQSTEVLFVSGNYGLTNNFSIGGLGFYLPASTDSSKMFSINSKFSISFPNNFNLATGFLAGIFNENGSNKFPVLGYGLFTYGNFDSNITLGIGYGESGYVPITVSMLGGMHRLTNNISLILENFISYYSSGDPSLTFVSIGGVRFFWEHFSTTLGIGVLYEYYIPQNSTFGDYTTPTNIFAPIPYFDLAFNF